MVAAFLPHAASEPFRFRPADAHMYIGTRSTVTRLQKPGQARQQHVGTGKSSPKKGKKKKKSKIFLELQLFRGRRSRTEDNEIQKVTLRFHFTGAVTRSLQRARPHKSTMGGGGYSLHHSVNDTDTHRNQASAMFTIYAQQNWGHPYNVASNV